MKKKNGVRLKGRFYYQGSTKEAVEVIQSGSTHEFPPQMIELSIILSPSFYAYQCLEVMIISLFDVSRYFLLGEEKQKKIASPT